MRKDPRIHLRDILERIDRIERYTATGRQAYLDSDLIQDAVIRSFEVIGEAIKRLGKDFTALHASPLWGDFAAFRDILIHQYDRVDPTRVWDYIHQGLPALKAEIVTLLERLDPEG